MSTKINVRNPYFVKTTNALLTSATMSLHIYEGVLGTRPSDSLKYTITKTPLSGETYVVFEIAEVSDNFKSIFFKSTGSSSIC